MTRYVVVVASPGYDPDTALPCDSWLTVRAVCWAARKDKRTYHIERTPGPLSAWWRARLAAFDARFRTQFLPPGGIP